MIDDVIVFGSNQEEHDARLGATLRHITITLNMEKCAFCKTSLKFLGHIIDQDGIRADPDKTAAIQRMETPKNITDLRRFMGMVNQLGKFSPNISDLNQPLRALLNAWVWGPRAGARICARQRRIGQADGSGFI